MLNSLKIKYFSCNLYYSNIRLLWTLWDYENMFLITGISYKRIDKLIGNDWEMKVSSL